MDIKNKIQSEINDYQIKTTSQQILARFELEKRIIAVKCCYPYFSDTD